MLLVVPLTNLAPVRSYLDMWTTLECMTPSYPLTHDNTRLGVDENEDLDGETDDEGQCHPIVSAREIPKYGRRTEDDHPKIPMGLTQDMRDRDHLMEWFAGWAIFHAEKFRRFIIVSRLPHLERWKQWQHVRTLCKPSTAVTNPFFQVRIMTPDDFAVRHQITFGEDKGSRKIVGPSKPK